MAKTQLHTGAGAPETSADPSGFARVHQLAGSLAASLSQVLSGKPNAIEAAITTLLARGHLLIEDVPGVGKTTLATVLARSIDARMNRIQFTSDMLPTDVTGLSIYNQDNHEFQFHPGPIFTNIAVADEVNRATPRTQSALLEAMSESAVTVDGHTHRLPQLFIVLATQNPGDLEGTFPLPEAQRDRFMARISLGYPDLESEVAMIAARGSVDPAEKVVPVASVSEILEAQELVTHVHLSEEVGRYAVNIVAATRAHSEVALGASPRATLHLIRMARSRAAVQGRAFVSPEDIAKLAETVIPHRLVMQGHFSSINESHAVATGVVSSIVASMPIK